MALSFKEKMANALLGRRADIDGSYTMGYAPEIQSFVDSMQDQPYIQNYLSNPKETTLSLEQLKEGFPQGLNSGIPELAQKQRELGIRTPQTEQELLDAQSGEFNKPTMLNVGTATTPRLGGFFGDIGTGFRENYAQGFSPDNLAPQQGKGFAQRLGEGFGTLARVADSPVGRGLIAYGLSRYLGDTNPLEQGLTAAVGRQQSRMEDQLYRQRLNDMGYTQNELEGIRGNVTADVYKNLANSYKLNNSVKWGDLAEFNPQIKAAIEANPELADSFVPASVMNQILRMPLTNAQIANLMANAQYTSGAKTEKTQADTEKTKASTEKTKAETGQVGKPKVSINIKQGGTKSVIEHKGGSGGKGGSDRPTKAQYTQAQIQAELKRRGLI